MRSRLAPSPTGSLHVGNLRTFLLTWLHVRAAGGALALRVDDLDAPRVRPEAVAGVVEELDWLGLRADPGLEVVVQSRRAPAHADAAARLLAAGLAYPCVCSRREVETAASAPHGPDGPRYPGTCRGRWRTVEQAAGTTGRPVALRLRVDGGPVAFEDEGFGPQTVPVAEETGDFVVWRGTGVAAYQLATVVDDAAAGVDLVVRGADLLPSTARQLLLARALGLPPPRWRHVPLVVDAAGRRLAKRDGDRSLAALRAAGFTPEGVVGALGSTAGLCRPDEVVAAADLVARYDPARPDRAPVVLAAGLFDVPR